MPDIYSLLGTTRRQRTEAPQNELQTILDSNATMRARLAQAGEQDPTKRGPSAFERALGIMRVPTAGIEATVHNAFNAPSDQNMNVLEEMKKSARGQTTYSGGDLVEELLGVKNKWAKMGLGLVVDVLLDPLTYMGTGLATKTSKMLEGGIGSLAVEGAFNADDIARVLNVSDDAAKGIFKAAGLADDAVIEGTHAGALTAQQSRDFMRAAAEAVGDKGGLKFFGKTIWRPSKSLQTTLDSGADALKATKPVEWFDKAFRYPENADLYRMGNKVFNAGQDVARRTRSGKRLVADILGDDFERKLADMADEKTRQYASVAYSRQVASSPALRELVTTLDKLKGATDEEAEVLTPVVRDLQDRFIQEVGDGTAAREFLSEMGLDNTQITQAMDALGAFQQQMKKLIDVQREANVDVRQLFGEGSDSMGYMLGMSPRTRNKASQAISDEVLQSLGIDPAELLGDKPRSIGEFFSKYAPSLGKKKYLTPEARLRGVTIDDIANMVKETDIPFSKFNEMVNAEKIKFYEGGSWVDPKDVYERMAAGGKLPKELGIDLKATGGKLATELDIAVIGGEATRKAYANAAYQGYVDDVANLVGDMPEAKAVAEQMLTKAKALFTNDKATEGFLRGYDRVLNLWKRSATIYNFPRFPARNGFSNKVLQIMEGMFDPASEKTALEIVGKLNSGQMRLADIAAKSVDELDDTERLLKEALEDRVYTTATELSEQVGRAPSPMSYKGTIGKVETKLGAANEIIENQSRLAVYFAARKQGMSREAAAMMVDKTLYSYDPSMMTMFERNFMRRLVPFWVFMSQNTPHMAELMVKKPRAIAWVGHLQNEGERTNPIDSSVMPEWMRDAFSIPTPGKDARGNALMLQTSGWLPTGDLDLALKAIVNPGSVPREMLSNLSPLLKTPIEIITNHDVYYQDEIERYKGETRRAPAYLEAFDSLARITPGLSKLWAAMKESLGWYPKVDPDTQDTYLAIPGKTQKALRDLNPWMNAIGKTLADTPTQKYDLTSYLTGTKLTPYQTDVFTRQTAYDANTKLQEAVRAAKDQGKIEEEKPKSRRNVKTIQDLLGGK